jgi:hypothetical protein
MANAKPAHDEKAIQTPDARERELLAHHGCLQ